MPENTKQSAIQTVLFSPKISESRCETMPTGDQYLTVQEFAQRAGVTVQAVYQRLEKDLKSYLKAEKGRKYIHSDALQYMKH